MYRILLSFLFLFLLQTGFAFSQCNVTLGTDTGVVGELRDCIVNQADAVVDVQVDVVLTMGEIAFDRDVEIVGAGDPGTGPTITQTDSPGRLFVITDNASPSNVVIRNLTLTGTSVTESGGLIRNINNNLTVDCSNLIDMTVDSPGGAIHSTGDDGSLLITESTISGNTAVNNGGGIFVNDHTATIVDSTIEGNSSTSGDGGGIAIGANGILDMTNSTVTNNSADSSGGGIFNSGATSNIDNTTITANSATTGGGIDNTGTLIVANSIIANQTLGGDCSDTGTLTSDGGNIESAMSCGFMSMGDLQDTDPLLGPLANNGGKTDTHILLPGSLAIDNAGTCGLPDDDQRGQPRDVDPCDSGSVEVQKASLTITKVTDPAGLLDFDFTSDIPDKVCNPLLTAGNFSLDDGDSINCTITEGTYNVTEIIPADNSLSISCSSQPAAGVMISDTNGTLDFTTLPADTEVDCTFTNVDDSVFTLDVVLGGPGSGTVTGPTGVPNNGGINCPGDCTESYNPGTNVTLIAAPNAGSEFQEWSGDCNESGEVTINSDKTCVATFKIEGGGDVLNPGDPIEFIQDNIPEVKEGGEGTFIVTARNATNANLTNVEITVEDLVLEEAKEIISARLEPSNAFLEPDIGSCIILENSVECDIASLSDDVDVVIDFVAEDVSPGDVDIELEATADQFVGLAEAIALVIITSDSSGCTVASPGTSSGSSMLLFLLIPVVVLTRKYLRIKR